ncbi:unnamed protein product [[Candida] boidinii]|nr:unnamed protein product [[Candida] boidinii]
MPSNDEQEDKKSETEAEDDNYDPLKALDIEEETKDDGGDNNDNTIDDNDVAIFNQVISFFITSSLLTDPEFDSLTPSEKSQKVVEEYNKAHNTNLKLKLNFAATTSYNKKFLKQNDTPVKLIPLNPFCLRPDITVPMTEKEEKLYSEYKESENYILETGRWDEFPIGSRLFIGNLAVNTLNPDDVYRVFSAYGVVKQVNLKQGFGFVQFDKAESCSRAIQGEKNVPLHNKIMHLEVSKYHTQKAIENQKKASSRDGDDKGRGREREASPTRDNNNSNKRSERSPLRAKNETDSKLIVTNDCSRFFFKDILSRLKKDGIVYEIEELNCSVDQVPSESITNAAYNGIVSVLLTCGNDHLNVMAYESTPDGGIKFEEYSDISLDEAINISLTAKAKRLANQPRGRENRSNRRQSNNDNGRNNNNNNGSRRNRRNNQDKGQPKNSNQALYGTSNNDNNDSNNGGRNMNNRNNNNDKYGNNQGRAGRSRYDNNKNSSNPYPSFGNRNNNNRYGQTNNSQQQLFQQHLQQQQQRQDNNGNNSNTNNHRNNHMGNNRHNRHNHNNQNNNSNNMNNNGNQGNIGNNVNENLFGQLKNLDPNTLQTMLSLAQQMNPQLQSPPQQQQQQQPVQQFQPQNYQQNFPQQPHQPQPMNPNQYQGNQNVLGLFKQLQNTIPGNSPPPPMPYGLPQQQQQPPQQQQPQHYGQPQQHHQQLPQQSMPLQQGNTQHTHFQNQPNAPQQPSSNSNNQGGDASDLFETLARLRNNM